MKQAYVTPEVELITFATEDVITTSTVTAEWIPELPLDEL